MRNANWTTYETYMKGDSAWEAYKASLKTPPAEPQLDVYRAYQQTLAFAPKGRSLIFYDGFREGVSIYEIAEELVRLGVKYISLAAMGSVTLNHVAIFRRYGFYQQSTLLDQVPKPYVYEQTGETVPALFLAYAE